MIIQNFDMLDLVVNGDHRSPPHPNRRPDFHYIRALSIPSISRFSRGMKRLIKAFANGLAYPLSVVG
jgi:hypothetical protein